jgi:hypothetical protein
LAVVPRGEEEHLIALHRKHGLYPDVMTVATVPEDYEQRLVEVAPPPSNASGYSPSTLTILRSPNSSATARGSGTT